MEQYTKENFAEKVEQKKGFSLVEFWAPWCVYCRQISPELPALSEELSIPLGQVNVDEEPALAERYRVMTIPAFLLFQDGKPGERLIAPADKDAILDWLDEQGV